MPQITISIDEDVEKILSGRAKKNLFTLREQIEDILRKSAVRTKKGASYRGLKVDDNLVGIFSREKRGRKKKKKVAAPNQVGLKEGVPPRSAPGTRIPEGHKSSKEVPTKVGKVVEK